LIVTYLIIDSEIRPVYSAELTVLYWSGNEIQIHLLVISMRTFGLTISSYPCFVLFYVVLLFLLLLLLLFES